MFFLLEVQYFNGFMKEDLAWNPTSTYSPLNILPLLDSMQQHRWFLQPWVLAPKSQSTKHPLHNIYVLAHYPSSLHGLGRMMASQSMEEEGSVPNTTLVSRLLTVVPVEIRLQIYENVFHGSRVRLRSVHRPTPKTKTLILRPSHHYQLLLTSRQIYAEVLSPYWSSTIIDSNLHSLFDTANFAEILRTIPYFAQPLIREIRCNGFREVPYLNLNQFVGLFARIEIIVLKPASLYVSRRFYRDSTWSDEILISRAQWDLRRRFPTFGLGGPNNVQVLQKVQFPVIARSRKNTQIRLSVRNKDYPAKVRL